MKKLIQLTLFLTSLLINICFAEQSKVLIINSDASVPKYLQISNEFKKTLSKNIYQWVELNLENNKNTETDIRQLIEKENPDFVYCIGSKAYSISQNIARNKTLLFSAAINWQRLNINDKTYGVANELLPEQDMTLLHLLFPSIKKIGILYSKKFNQEYIDKIKNTAQIFNIDIIDTNIEADDEIESMLSELLPKVEMFWLISDPLVLESKTAVKTIFHLAKQQNKPVYAYNELYIKYGAVLSISSDTGTIGRQSATLMMSLQDKSLPATPVQAPAGSNITLNMCVAESLKVPLNKDALDSVNNIASCTP